MTTPPEMPKLPEYCNSLESVVEDMVQNGSNRMIRGHIGDTSNEINWEYVRAFQQHCADLQSRYDSLQETREMEGDALCKRIAELEAERDSLREQVEKLTSYKCVCCGDTGLLDDLTPKIIGQKILCNNCNGTDTKGGQA